MHEKEELSRKWDEEAREKNNVEPLYKVHAVSISDGRAAPPKAVCAVFAL